MTVHGIITLTKQGPTNIQAQPGQHTVTPRMREAGASVLLELSGVVDSWALAERVYIAMYNAGEKSLAEKAKRKKRG